MPDIRSDSWEATLNETDIVELQSLYNHITSLNVTIHDEILPDCIQKLNSAISSQKLALSTCWTAKLYASSKNLENVRNRRTNSWLEFAFDFNIQDAKYVRGVWA